jgi:hypothetical protein
VASASRSAPANSGRERISYRSVKNGSVTSAGTDTVTYSGIDWNYAAAVPAANFQDAGTDVIGGLRLTHLHATRLSGLPDDPTLARYANLASKSAPVAGGTLAALDVWADNRGVVHQMKIQLEGGDGQTTLTVTFTDSGQPQSITAPATSNQIP